MNKYKRFLFFQFEDYYPCGGLNDVRKEFDTVEEFQAYIESDEYAEWTRDYEFLFDCEERIVVWDKK